MPRTYTLTDWSTHGPRVLELKKAGKTFKQIEELIGVKHEAIRAWFNKQKTPPEEAPMHIQLDALPTDEVTVLPGQLSIDDPDTPPDNAASLSTIIDIVPVNGEISEPLSSVEVQTLEHYERIIAQGLQTFVEVGHALLVIRDQRLYRQSSPTFEDYLRQRWDLSRPRAYQLISAAQVIDTVSTIVDIVPVNESQARPLTSLPPAQQAEVWKEVVETAPPSGITAKHVQETVKRVRATPAMPRIPKPQELEPEKPLRIDVQERLFLALKSVPDRDVFALFVRMYQWVEKYATRHNGEIRGEAVRDNLSVIRARLTRATWISETTPDYAEREWDGPLDPEADKPTGNE
jgi:hypothetical protein